VKAAFVKRNVAGRPSFHIRGRLHLDRHAAVFVFDDGKLHFGGLAPNRTQRARPVSKQACVHGSVRRWVKRHVLCWVMRLSGWVRRVGLRLGEDRHEASHDERNKDGDGTNHLRPPWERHVGPRLGMSMVLTTIDSRDPDFCLL
jgi:hypothetical protein